MKEEKIVMYDSNEAAKPATVSGWVSRNGHFYREEHVARYDGCTHLKCDCGDIMSRGWTKCKSCRDKAAAERFSKMPVVEWNGTDAVYSYDFDEYFFSEDEFRDYLEGVEPEDMPEDLRLVICDKNPYRMIDNDYWSDEAPEDWDGDLPKVAQDKLDELNAIIQTLPPLSYSPGKSRINYKP